MVIPPERVDALSPDQQVRCARDLVSEARLHVAMAVRGDRRWFPTRRNLQARGFTQRFEQHAEGLQRCTTFGCGEEVKAFYRTLDQWLKWETKP